jgi:hypothetical protein
MSEEEIIENQSADDSPQSSERMNENLPTVQVGSLQQNIEPQNTNQLQTENMEVHKHPHHVTHKKKWGEYLLEFFMLFLAVFLGFVAENIREHVVEHNRSKEYAISLVQDLQNDTTSINVQKKSARIYIAIADSLLRLSKKPLEGRNAAEFFTY